MFHAVVIGAGPAGSLAALLLARGRISVTLIEQHRFPREKVCGECVSALGWQVLERVGLGEKVKAAGAMEMRRGILHATSGRSAQIALPGAMWGISRSLFDSILLDAARNTGVRVLQPARFEEHGQDARGTWVRVRDLKTNALKIIRSDLVVVADGKEQRAGESGDFGIKAHFELKQCPRDAVQLFGAAGCYGGVAPIEYGLFNIACSVPRERIERARDVQAVFAGMVKENRGLAQIMRGGRRVSPWLASPLPRFGIAKEWPAGVIPIGNAAAALEPIGGEGIGLALASAQMASESIAQDRQRELPARFRKLWNTRRLLWRAVGMLVSRPALCELAVEMMNVTNAGEEFVMFAKGAAASNEAPAIQ